MRRTRIFFIAALGGVVVLATGLSVLNEGSSTSPQITLESYKKIEKGMTEQQVVSIIGVPPGDYRGHEGSRLFHTYGERPNQADVGKISTWLGEDSAIDVYFDHSGRVQAAQISALSYSRPTWWQRLKRLLVL